MVKKKYALRFPELQKVEPDMPANLYSEQALREMEESFRNTFDMMRSLADCVIQKNRTRELGKQLNAQRKALDAELDQAVEQERIELTEYSRQLQIQLKAQKEQLELEIKRLAVETSQQVSDFSLTVEEAFKKSQLLKSMIRHEQEVLDSYQPYLARLKADYSNRREYSQCWDAVQKSYKRITAHLNTMI